MSALYGFGLGVVSTNAQGATLDAFYPRPLTHVNGEIAGVLEGCLLYTSPSPRD